MTIQTATFALPAPTEPLRVQTAVGHADLLRLMGRPGFPKDALAAGFLRDLLGLKVARNPGQSRRKPPAGTNTRDISPPEAFATTESPVKPAPSPDRQVAPDVPYYRVTAWRQIPVERLVEEPPAWFCEAEILLDDTPGDPSARPASVPLYAWPRLWPFLRAALGALREGEAVDQARLITCAARGSLPRRLPRRRRLHWAPSARILLDLSAHLEPIHADARALIAPLLRLRGAAGLDLLLTGNGARGPFQRHVAVDRWTWVEAAELPWHTQSPVLVLGDLGCYADDAQRAAWIALGRRLRRAGIRPMALMCCPARYWYPELAALYRMVAWDRNRQLPARLDVLAGLNPAPTKRPMRLIDDPGANRLLHLLAPVVRLEPALLRALRLRLRGKHLDLGAELAAWNHPDLEAKQPAREWRDRFAVERRRAGFVQQPPAERRLAAELIRAHNRHLARSVIVEEAGNLRSMLGDPARQGQDDEPDYLARMVRTLDAPPDGPLGERLRQRALRLADREPRGGWQDERRLALWVLARREQLQSPEGCRYPPGVESLDRVGWLLNRGGEPRTFGLYQVGEDLRFVASQARTGLTGRSEGELAPEYKNPNNNLLPEALPSTLLTSVWMTAARVLYKSLNTYGDGPDTWSGAFPEPATRLPLPSTGLLLRVYDAELTIEPLSRPVWATAMGRDPAGLFCEIQEGQSTRRLCWVPPGPMPDADADPSVRKIEIPWGAWWNSETLGDWREGAMTRPAWAARSGQDEIGLWAEIDLNDSQRTVTQRLRWLWPGEFLMGSPKQEADRELWRMDETQHPVILTRGLWLADTACTQAMWRAVMGCDPSGFLGPDIPVEQVSWNDVQDFIERLNTTTPGLAARLPSEAEWEYACRAGTETPFWFGETMTTEQVNYDGNYPYRNGPTGRDRGQTVGVHALPANGWGMYQMHGNVWEWVQDSGATYSDGTGIDPTGPATGVDRICRGGSWHARAALCRSGMRRAVLPLVSVGNRGFRLALGPTGSPVEPEIGASRSHRNGDFEHDSRLSAGPEIDPTEGLGSGLGYALRAAWRRLRQ